MVNPIILRKAAFTLFLMTLASAVYGQSMDFAKYSRQRSYESQNNTKVCTLSYSNLSGGKIYCNDVEISQEQYMDASMILNPKLWYQYDGGSRNRKSGIIMMSIGVPLFFGGLLMSCISPENYYLSLGGLYVMAAGTGLTAGGVACYVVGVQRRRRSIRNFNNLAGKLDGSIANTINISLGVCPSGSAGLWMTF